MHALFDLLNHLIENHLLFAIPLRFKALLRTQVSALPGLKISQMIKKGRAGNGMWANFPTNKA
jgi:hypothetical protein